MSIDVYGEILFGIPLGEEPYSDENDMGAWRDPETEEMFFEMGPSNEAHLIPLGSYESGEYLLGYEILDSYWGTPQELALKTFETKPEWHEDLIKKCEILGVPWTPPKFYLSSLFSN